MRIILKLYFLFVFYLAQNSVVAAEPFVIYDAGDTVSTAPYTTILLGGKRESYLLFWFSKEMPDAIIDEEDKHINELFPLETDLSPQYMPSGIEAHQAGLPSPLCVVGSDELSLKWLRKNSNTLNKIKAHCLLVSAPNVEQARLVLNALGSVPVSLAKGNQLGKHFQFQHYPVLITPVLNTGGDVSQ